MKTVGVGNVQASLINVASAGESDIEVPATYLEIFPAVPNSWNTPTSIRFGYNLVESGTIFPVPKFTLTTADLEAGTPVDVDGPAKGTFAIIEDETQKATKVEGEITLAPDGESYLFTATKVPAGTSIDLPASIYGPLSTATRGETVKNEVLGDGNSAIPFQSFELAKSPLTYLADAGAPGGRRSTLEIFVNGKKWSEAPSFYKAEPGDRIYVVGHDAEGKTTVTFGDGELGSRLPTGVRNVVANYRHGVGGNVEANAIKSLKKPIKGVTKVFNPFPATGGEDVPSPALAREKAIQSTQVLGRLVSLLDFEVEADRFGGVQQAKASWAWDGAGEDATVHLWIVTGDDGDPSQTLHSYLLDLAEPGVQLSVEKATAMTALFELDLEVDSTYEAEAVYAAVMDALFDDASGPFSLRNTPIGGFLHRSQLFAVIHASAGVLGVKEITINGEPIPASLEIPEGHYFDMRDEPIVINTVTATLASLSKVTSFASVAPSEASLSASKQTFSLIPGLEPPITPFEPLGYA